ncbi:MAG: hypothetical protein GTO63_02155, partial [Anaerolineae bacterium]|nr:hypothetical protein [Anaerolineae bacterium]NIN93858.1 hypothetical protein [Anaerolineae bacterium]
MVKLVQRIEDLRFQIGEYVATEIEKLGFTVQLDPSTGLEAFFKVYAGDSTAGEWHIYTEGWIFGAIIQFDDGQPNFFYNGDFGSDVWGHYTPPPSLTVPCVALERAEYTTLDERSALLEACTNAGVRDAVRVFLVATKDVSLAHTSVSDAIFAVDAAFNNWWTLKAAIKGGVTGGTLRVGQPIHTVSGWNNVGGFTWVYEEYQRKLFSDEAVPTHPHTGTSTPFRADYVVDTVGPDGKFSVPTDAQVWNSTAMAFENAGSGVEAASKVTYTFKFGNWHHGQAMTMDDIRWSMAEFFRIVQSTGDLNPESPSLAAAPGFEFVNDLFRGAKFYEGNDTVEVWFDFWNP